MAASKKQRVGIWIIAAFMLLGTIGSFAMIILANSNEQQKQARINELTAEYQAAQEAQAEAYYDKVSKYAAEEVEAFDADAVTELTTKDLEEGDGETLTAESTFTAYYIGWNPDGEIFDSSLDGESLKEPFTASPGMVIEGWTEGVDGMKVGGVRELTIPSDLAYGEVGSGELIPPNTPLKFIVFVVDPVEVPQELLDYYQSGRGY